MERLMDALSEALEYELREHNFYLKHSRKTADTIGKKIFLQIAADEDKHFRKLQSTQQELFRKGTWPEFAANTIDSLDAEKIFWQLAGQADKMPVTSWIDIAALKHAIELETQGHSFYSRLSSEAATDQGKEFFGIIAALEWKHLMLLQDAMLFYESPADWRAKTKTLRSKANQLPASGGGACPTKPVGLSP